MTNTFNKQAHSKIINSFAFGSDQTELITYRSFTYKYKHKLCTIVKFSRNVTNIKRQRAPGELDTFRVQLIQAHELLQAGHLQSGSLFSMECEMIP